MLNTLKSSFKANSLKYKKAIYLWLQGFSSTLRIKCVLQNLVTVTSVLFWLRGIKYCRQALSYNLDRRYVQ